MKKKFSKPIWGILVLLLVAVLCAGTFIIAVGSSYTYYLNASDINNVWIEFDKEGVVEYTSIDYSDEGAALHLTAVGQGYTTATIHYNIDDLEVERFKVDFSVGWFYIIVRQNWTTDFTGWQAMPAAAALFFIASALYLIRDLRSAMKRNMYSYNTLKYTCVIVAFIGLAVIFTAMTTLTLAQYRHYGADSMGKVSSEVFLFLILLSMPLILVFSLFMSISNISLIRHEGFRPANALGIIISVFLALGVAVCFLATNISVIFNIDYMAGNIIQNVVSALFGYFEALLLGTIFYSFIVSRHTPAYDKDFVIILGCGIKKDGTLLPLLRGRVDKAVEFYHNQWKATGKKAVLVPSGGHGTDEVISEGEAMRRYLLEQGIPGKQIMPECESTNTLQNMEFSKKLIEQRTSEGKVAFSTTNYHVFRGGMLAGQAGLQAEGMGSKTKWYFWPNAFVREFAGLLQINMKKEIFIVLVIAVIAAGAAFLK